MAATSHASVHIPDKYTRASSPDSPLHTPSALEDNSALDSSKLAHMGDIVREELSTRCITADHSKELKEIGGCTSTLEARTDDTTMVLTAHAADITFIHDEVKDLENTMEDLENGSCHCNLRVNCLPETITDLHDTITALFQELSPNISLERFHFHRVHRALTCRQPDGPPMT